VVEEVTLREIEDEYDSMLDMSFELFKIGQHEFTPSNVLKKCDPVAYRQEILDYIDALLQDENLFELNNKYFREPVGIVHLLTKLEIVDDRH
jgi:hypothetical protein